LQQGDYSVLFTVDGVQTKGVTFVIDPPIPQLATLELALLGNVVNEGQAINKCDPEYPNSVQKGKPGCLGPGDITASVKQAPDAPMPQASLELLKDGKPFVPAADLPADGKWVLFSASPKGPEPGAYTVQMTADGHPSTLNFTIVAPPPPQPGKGTGTDPGPKPLTSTAKWTMQVVSMDCTLTNGQSFLRDDAQCGGIFRAEDVHVVVQPDSMKNLDSAAVDLRWSKTPPGGGPGHPFGGPISVAGSMFGKAVSAPAPVTRGAYSVHLFVNDKDVKHFDFEVK
jgi:hypothetical protein